MRKPACEAVACTSYLRFWGKITMAAAILVPFPEAVVPVRPTMRANLKILSCQSTGTMVLIMAHQSLPVYEFTTDPDGPSKIVHSFTD